jgi:hypothetical protein
MVEMIQARNKLARVPEKGTHTSGVGVEALMLDFSPALMFCATAAIARLRCARRENHTSLTPASSRRRRMSRDDSGVHRSIDRRARHLVNCAGCDARACASDGIGGTRVFASPARFLRCGHTRIRLYRLRKRAHTMSIQMKAAIVGLLHRSVVALVPEQRRSL